MKYAAALVGLLLALCGSPAVAYPAHYFVVHEGLDGALRVSFHQMVEISGSPQSEEPQPPNAFESRLTAVLADKLSGRAIFAPRAVSSRWLRGEFEGEHEIDGRSFEVKERDYVVRVPVESGTLLSLRAAPDSEATPAGRVPASLDIDLDVYLATAKIASLSAAGVDSGSLIYTGDPSNRLDLLIIAEGYTAGQRAEFIAQVTVLANQFLTISPYKDFAHLMNVSWLFVPSNESGADKPFCNDGMPIIARDTAFDATFCSSGLRRFVVVSRPKVLAAASGVPDWDSVLVLVNDSEYGGSGGGFSVVTNNINSVGIAQHEFGHTFTHLADEYTTAYPEFPPCSDLQPTTRPCEPNVTDQTARSLIKWTRWINPATPVPTTGPLSDQIGAGLWTGARYLTSGMYRQCENGQMRSFGRPFCHVDSEAFVKRLYGGGWGAPVQGVSLIEPGSMPAGTTVIASLSTQVAFAATAAGSLAAEGLSATWLVDNNPVQTRATVHGAVQNFDYIIADAAPHTVELRISDGTPFLLDRPVRSRLWNVQALPLGATAIAVEYRYPSWDHYFVTARTSDISALDSGAFAGWVRTGQTFAVWTTGGANLVATCRFFGVGFAPKSSHFYTPFSSECASTKNDPNWQYEDVAFYLQLPSSGGTCAAGLTPLYRLYNRFAGNAPNHRYSQSRATFNQMIEAGWTFEGNGATGAFACIPQ